MARGLPSLLVAEVVRRAASFTSSLRHRRASPSFPRRARETLGQLVVLGSARSARCHRCALPRPPPRHRRAVAGRGSQTNLGISLPPVFARL